MRKWSAFFRSVAKNKSFYVMDIYYFEVSSSLQTLSYIVLNISYKLETFYHIF